MDKVHWEPGQIKQKWRVLQSIITYDSSPNWLLYRTSHTRHLCHWSTVKIHVHPSKNIGPDVEQRQSVMIWESVGHVLMLYTQQGF